MSLSVPFSVAEGSFVLGNPSAFVACLKAFYRDLQRFMRAGCELVPSNMLPPDYLDTFPSLKDPTRDDKNAQGHRLYQFIDSADPDKGLTSASEMVLFAAQALVLTNLQEYHRKISDVIDYIITRCSHASQSELRADAAFSAAELAKDHREAAVPTAAFFNQHEVHAVLFRNTFGYGADATHSGCIHADRLDKAVLFLAADPARHDRVIEELQEKHPDCSAREAVDLMLRRERERTALVASRQPSKVGVSGPSSVRPHGLVAVDEESPM